MQTPELLLSDLNKALRELRSAVVVLNKDDIDAGLLPIMRNLTLAEVLGNEWIVAVGGSQGAGKTNLICTMYGLSIATGTNWLQDNEGQGERYPVLIQEDDAENQPKGYLRKLIKDENSDTCKIEEVAAKDINEFSQACRGEMPEVMLPVLKVPRKFFKRNGQALILLPGYETSNRENQEWQILMRQVLIGAAGCMIVTDPTRLANQQQLDIVKDMLSSELRASRPLVVVSKTEALANDPQRLQELKRSAASIFKLKDGSSDPTVICSGSGDDDYVKQWMPELIAAVQNMSVGGGELREMQLARLEKLLTCDLNQVINLIRTRVTLFRQEKNHDTNGQLTVSDFLEKFDDAVEELRSDYYKAVENMLREQLTKAKNRLDDRLIDKHEGVFNKVKNVFDTVSETQRAIESDVTGAWGTPREVLPKYAQLLDNFTKKKLKRPSVPVLPTSLSAHPLQRLGYMDVENKPVESTITNPKFQANLGVLLKNTGNSNEDIVATVKLLPVMALEYARIASVLPELVGVNSSTLEALPQMDILASAHKVQEEFGQFKDVSSSVIKGLGAMLAVDIAADGQIDTMPALLAALGVGATATTEPATTPISNGAIVSSTTIGGAAIDGAVMSGTAATVALSVAGVVAIGFLANSALRQVQRHDKDVSVMANAMLLKIKDQHLSHFVSHFDDLMRTLRNHLNQSLRQRYKLDQTLMEQDRLAKALTDTRVLQNDLLRELASSGKTLQLFGGRSE